MDATLAAKWLAVFVLGLGSIVIGMLPPIYVLRRASGRPLACSVAFLSCLLCFGAGVLFGTAIVHMTAEARPVLSATESNIPLTEVLLGLGFLLVYCVEEVVHLTLHRKSNREYNTNNSARYSIASFDGAPCYGSVKICSSKEEELVTEKVVTEESSSSAFLLLLALSLHSTIEGFAIGVEPSSKAVLFMLLAVSMHKFVMAFCLGMEMSLSEGLQSLRRSAAFLGVFSLTSVLGVFGGILVRMNGEEESGEMVCAVMQGLAAGAILHVALLEILPRERSRCHQIGFVQFSSVCAGFGLSVLLQYFTN